MKTEVTITGIYIIEQQGASSIAVAMEYFHNSPRVGEVIFRVGGLLPYRFPWNPNKLPFLRANKPINIPRHLEGQCRGWLGIIKLNTALSTVVSVNSVLVLKVRELL